jgi:hypothetical protein
VALADASSTGAGRQCCGKRDLFDVSRRSVPIEHRRIQPTDDAEGAQAPSAH